MDRDGYTPVAVHKDAVYLVSDEPDPVAACPPSVTLGTGLGHFKVQDAAILSWLSASSGQPHRQDQGLRRYGGKARGRAGSCICNIKDIGAARA